MAWLALRLEVERAAADALSDALLEGGADSVSIDALDAPHTVLSALFADAAALERCRALLPQPFAVRELVDEDWVARSQAQFQPLRVGRLWVGASWHQAPAAVDACVRIDPGLAFGTGSHASTRLVLGFLETKIKGGERVLDYGCGSGVLAIAAAKLGAATVDAVDVDPLAIEVTRANARINGVELGCCLAHELAAGQYDLVVANILAKPLIALAPLLAGRAAARAELALAGLLEDQAAEVARAYAGAFDLAVSAREEDWVLLSGTRR
jgi:ribosomal protein L11 methyltransferase